MSENWNLESEVKKALSDETPDLKKKIDLLKNQQEPKVESELNIEKIVGDGKNLLTHLAKQVPFSYFSVDKQKFIGHELLPKVSDQHKQILKKLVNGFLEIMRMKGASDIDFGGMGCQKRVWFRIHGDKFPIQEFGTYEITEFDILIQSILLDSQKEDLYEHRNVDFSYTFASIDKKIYRNRANIAFDLNALSLNMRAIETRTRRFEQYGFDNHVARNLHLAYTKEGLILITGITGSGKSTTLDAIVDLNNQTVKAHIIIIASPIEFVHTPKKCIIRHREVGRDTLSFKQGTIEALRQDPDIIIIGEMRDPETIMSALEVADSGHKVFSTLHTSSAVESIDRIIAEIPNIEQERVRSRLADVLRVVISQKLVPTLVGDRVLAREIMVMTPSIRAAIKNNNVNEIYQMISEGNKIGMCTIEQDLAQLYYNRKISKDTALNYSNNKRRMQQLLKMA
jgi:twitching motility protein PilT